MAGFNLLFSASSIPGKDPLTVYSEQLNHTSHAHTADRTQLVEAHHLKMDVLKVSHADHNRDVKLTHVRSLGKSNDDHIAELQKLDADHHTDLAAINETWESTVRLISMKEDSRIKIHEECHRAKVPRIRDGQQRELLKCQKIISNPKKQAQQAKDNEIFALSTVKILQKELTTRTQN